MNRGRAGGSGTGGLLFRCGQFEKLARRTPIAGLQPWLLGWRPYCEAARDVRLDGDLEGV